MLLVALLTMAQTMVKGKVTDRQTGQPLSHASVATEEGTVNTVTNDDGCFVLKTDRLPRAIRISHIGYRTRIVSVERSGEQKEIALTANSVRLAEVVVSAEDPKAILWAAIGRIEQNYPQKPELVRCFYRETTRRGSRFIAVAEAVTDMYKSRYSLGPQHDVVAIHKGRRLMSMKAADTLAVKIQGGPLIPLYTDIAKNPDYLLNEEGLAMCSFRMLPPQMIDDRLHYVISIVPSADAPVALMGGLLYIDKETLAFSRAELQLDVSDWRRASDYMLVRKPAGLRFRPKELSMTLVYHTDRHGVTRLSYVRNEIRFNCDWKRRLFASAYSTVSEMVVTDRLQQGTGIQRPRGRSSFGLRERFYDRVEYFEDPDFWADYNIIEPTESLEHAIDKLKKREIKNIEKNN